MPSTVNPPKKSPIVKDLPRRRGGRRTQRKGGVQLLGMAAARKSRGLSLFALAAKLGPNPSTLARYEKGLIFASQEMAARIAAELETTFDALKGSDAK